MVVIKKVVKSLEELANLVEIIDEIEEALEHRCQAILCGDNSAEDVDPEE